ncbi:UV-stimulated scaffold protein [Schistosoma japonicum]|nr:UV-stimulated scaffold protein [Schistosoma japonicum]
MAGESCHMPKTPNQKEIDPTHLQILLDKITTSGSNLVDRSLVEETIHLCRKSSATVSDLFRFATVQLRRKHAQIRLGVLRLLKLLSSPQAIVHQLTLCTNDAIKFVPLSKYLRNLILDNLQDTFSYMLQFESHAETIPPPKEAAKQLQTEAVELLLDWEYELEQGHFDITPWNPDSSASLLWVPSHRAKGQLKAFLNFLILDSRPLSNNGCVYSPTKQLIRKIREEREKKVQLSKNEFKKSRRLLIACLSEVEEFGESVEENLTSLSSILDILVPNPTVESNDDKTETISSYSETKSKEFMSTFDSLRLHGCIPGSSSGFGLNSSLTIEIQLPYNHEANSSTVPFGPKVYIKRSPETKDLEDSAVTFVRLASEKHKPKLIKCLQTLESIYPTNFPEELSSKRNDKIKILNQWIGRIQTLTSLFYDVIEFVDDGRIHNKNNPVQSPISLCYPDNNPASSDESDFEDVVSAEPESLCYSSTSHDNLQFEKAQLIDYRSLPVVNNTNQQLMQMTDEQCYPKSQNDETLGASTLLTKSCDVISSDITTNYYTLAWRSNEFVHRFWKPVNPDDYNASQDYLESAVSCISMNDIQIHSQCSQNSPEIKEDEIKLTAPRRLFCWAPLLSGSLCRRCDSSGRCPIHGRIVKRDKATGRPINIDDRKLLQSEMELIRLAKQKSRFSWLVL